MYSLKQVDKEFADDQAMAERVERKMIWDIWIYLSSQRDFKYSNRRFDMFDEFYYEPISLDVLEDILFNVYRIRKKARKSGNVRKHANTLLFARILEEKRDGGHHLIDALCDEDLDGEYLLMMPSGPRECRVWAKQDPFHFFPDACQTQVNHPKPNIRCRTEFPDLS